MTKKMSFLNSLYYVLLMAGAVVFVLPLNAIAPTFIPASQVFVAIAGFSGLLFMLTAKQPSRRDPILWGIIFVLIAYSLLELTSVIK